MGSNPQLRREKLTEERTVTGDELASYMGVEKKLLNDFLKAYGYKTGSISVKEFKELMVRSGLSYVDSKWYRTRFGDVDSIFEFLGSYSKEDIGKAGTLSSRLEGSMASVIAAKRAGMGDEEVFKFVAKKINVERELEIYDGRGMRSIWLSMAQHIGIAYMGTNILGEKFDNAQVEKLTDDYISALADVLKGAGTADEAVKRIKNSGEMEGLTVALAIESSQIMHGNKYGGGLKNRADAMKGQMDKVYDEVTRLASEAHPDFGKKVAKRLDDEDERNDFRRFFSATFLVSNFLKYPTGSENAERITEAGVYSYLIWSAANHVSRTRNGQAVAKSVLAMHGGLSDKLVHIAISDRNAYANLEKKFLSAMFIEDPEKAAPQIKQLADDTIKEYSKAVGLDPQKDRNIALFFSPEIIKGGYAKDQMKKALMDALGHFGFTEADVEGIMKGEYRQLYSKLKTSSFYRDMKQKDYNDEQIMKMAVNFIGSAAEIYLVKGKDGKAFMDEAVDNARTRKQTLIDFQGKKEEEEGEATNQALWDLWFYASRKLSATQTYNTFYYSMDAHEKLKSSKFGSQAARMYGFELEWLTQEWMMTPENTSAVKGSEFYSALTAKGIDETKALTTMANLIYPTSVMLERGMGEAEIRKGVLDYINKHAAGEISAEAIVKSLQERLPALAAKAEVRPVTAKPAEKPAAAEAYAIKHGTRKGRKGTEHFWTVEVEHLGKDILLGEGAVDANVKHKEQIMRERFGGLDERALRKYAKGVTVSSKGKTWKGGLFELLARSHAGKAFGRPADMASDYMKELRGMTEFSSWKAIDEFASKNGSIYGMLRDSADKIVESRFGFLGAKERENLKRECFLSDVAIMHSEYGTKKAGVTVKDINEAIAGLKEDIGGDVGRIIEKTISRAERSKEYSIWHLKEDGTRELIGTYKNGKAVAKLNTVDWKIGDLYYISHADGEREILDAYLPAFYYHYRKQNGNRAFMVNGSMNAEMTLLNLRAQNNPFDIKGTRPGAPVPAPRIEMEAAPPEAVETPLSMMRVVKPIEINPIVVSQGVGKGKSLQYIGIPAPVVGMSVPVISKEVILDVKAVSQVIANVDAGSFGSRYGFFDEVDSILRAFDPNANSRNENGEPDMDMLRQNFNDLVSKQFATDQDVINIAKAGGGDTVYMYLDDNGQGTITAQLPADGRFKLTFNMNSDGTFEVSDPNGIVAKGTWTYSEETKTVTTKTEQIRAPVFLTLNNLINGKLPYGIQYSAGGKIAFQFMYDAKTKLPKEYTGDVNFYPFAAVSRPIELGEGFVANPYLMGMWDVSGGTVSPMAGLSFTKTTSGSVVGFSLSGGVGVDLSKGAKEALPYIGAGLSAWGIHFGAGVNPVRIHGPLYGEFGYDWNRDGIMDYGFRMMNAGIIWIPDVVIDGQGVVGSVLGAVGKGLKKTYKKAILGEEAA